MATMQPVIIDRQQIVALQSQGNKKRDHRTCFIGFGVMSVLNVIFGLMAFGFGIGILAIRNKGKREHWANHSGLGIWLGAWVTFSGILGIIGWKRKKNSLVTTSMVINIVSSVITGIGIIISSVAVSFYRRYPLHHRYFCQRYFPAYHLSSSCLFELRIHGKMFTTMYGFLLFFIVAAFVMCVILAAFACKIVCSCECCYPYVTPQVLVCSQSNGQPAFIPAASNGQTYFVQGMSSAGQSGIYYPQQVLSSNTMATAPATAVTYAAGVQPSVVPPGLLPQREVDDRPPPYIEKPPMA